MLDLALALVLKWSDPFCSSFRIFFFLTKKTVLEKGSSTTKHFRLLDYPSQVLYSQLGFDPALVKRKADGLQTSILNSLLILYHYDKELEWESAPLPCKSGVFYQSESFSQCLSLLILISAVNKTSRKSPSTQETSLTMFWGGKMQLFLEEVGQKGTIYNTFKWMPMKFQSLLVKFPSWL